MIFIKYALCNPLTLYSIQLAKPSFNQRSFHHLMVTRLPNHCKSKHKVMKSLEIYCTSDTEFESGAENGREGGGGYNPSVTSHPLVRVLTFIIPMDFNIKLGISQQQCTACLSMKLRSMERYLYSNTTRVGTARARTLCFFMKGPDTGQILKEPNNPFDNIYLGYLASQ